MKVNEWPLNEGMFVYLTRPEDNDSMKGWHFVYKSGERIFISPHQDLPPDALCLELDWRLTGGDYDPLEVVEPGGEE